MENIKQLIEKLDKEVITTWDKYIELHSELDTHRGKPIGETNLSEVNRILKEIQETFESVYPLLHLIGTRHEFATNAVNSHFEFIETLKKAGAHKADDQEKSSIIT